METTQVRKEILRQRDKLSSSARDEKSARIRHNLLNLEEVQKADHIFMYLNFRSEVETMKLLYYFLEDNRKVSVPVVRPSEQQIEAVQITEPLQDLTLGHWGILEPTSLACAQSTTDPLDIDLVIMPGAVFDIGGGRMGYGGGYYDRYVSAIPQAIRAALAFEIQVVEKLKLQPHDEQVDYVVTEKRVIHNVRRGSKKKASKRHARSIP